MIALHLFELAIAEIGLIAVAILLFKLAKSIFDAGIDEAFVVFCGMMCAFLLTIFGYFNIWVYQNWTAMQHTTSYYQLWLILQMSIQMRTKQ